MNTEIAVLRAVLRLSRRRSPVTIHALLERVDADETAVRRALGALARSGLVQRSAEGPRLSMAGLAIAVAIVAGPQKRRQGRATVQHPRPFVLPIALARRGRAA